MRVYLLRHGETDANIDPTYPSHLNFPLNETGRNQAAQLGTYLTEVSETFSAVYASPALRAMETAGHVLPSREILVDERLAEQDFGDASADVDGFIAANPEYGLQYSPDATELAFPGGESLADVYRRMCAFFEELPESHSSDETVLVVSHYLSMLSYLSALSGKTLSEVHQTDSLVNCELLVLEFADGEWCLRDRVAPAQAE